MLKIAAVAIWLIAAAALYAGLRARAAPHHPWWHSAVIVLTGLGLLAAAGIGLNLLSSDVPRGVEDGGGWPERPGD